MQCFSLKENTEPLQSLIFYVNLYFKGFNNLWKKASYIYPFSSHSIFSLNLLNKAGIRSVIIAMRSWCPLRTFCTFVVIPPLALSVDYNIVHLSSLFMIWKHIYFPYDSPLPPSAVSWILFPASVIWALNVSKCHSRRSFKYTWEFQLGFLSFWHPSWEEHTQHCYWYQKGETVEKI